MADRHTLHFKHLEPFKNWLINNGWEMKPLSRHGYEVLRATKSKEWIIVYVKDEAKEHYSLTDNSIKWVNRWLNEVRIRKQVCDEIKKELDNFEYDCEITYSAIIEIIDKVEKGGTENAI